MTVQEMLPKVPLTYPLSDTFVDDVVRWMQPRQYPRIDGLRASQRPVIRFWARNTQGGLNCIQGQLQLDNVEAQYGSDTTIYTITGRLFPPLVQYVIDDGDSPQPVGTIEDGLVHSEISVNEGFHELGRIEPDDIDIRTDIEIDQFDGRAIKTSQNTTIEFSTWKVGPGFHKLFGGRR